MMPTASFASSVQMSGDDNISIRILLFGPHHMINSANRGQFHQCSTRSFYVCKLHAQLFCAYILGLYFTGARLLAQKWRVER